jgi:thiamine pyrophosphate-dependent acetolactate synthase large subunit-like protein
MPQTVADLILAQLQNYGVRHIFGVVGDAIFPLADALARQDALRFISAPNESSASHMAAAAAQLTGTLGVCIATAGPGAVGLADGAARARLDRSPLFCLTGQLPSAKIGCGANQDFDQNQFFTAVTTRSLTCYHQDALLEQVNRLICLAFAEQTAVHLAVPKDILAQPVPDGLTPWPPPPLVKRIGLGAAVYGDFPRAVAAIRAAHRPILVIGREARSASNALLALAQQLDAGIVLTAENKGAIPAECPRLLGGLGTAFLPECFDQADLLLQFGTAAYQEPYFPPRTPLIHFANEISPAPASRLLVLGEPEILAERLLTELNDLPPKEEWRLLVEFSHQDWIRSRQQIDEPSHPVPFFASLAAELLEDAIITLDVGSFVYWFDFGFPARKQQVLLSAKWRGMGAGIAAGIASCLATPQKQTVALVGDGGFLMSMADLSLLTPHRLPLAVFLLTNGLYALEQQKMQQEGFAPFGTELVRPDLPQIAAAFSLHYEKLNPANPRAGIAQALANTPSLVEVEVSVPDLPHL